jgi:SAM-dependent methyltransferase
MRTDHYDPHGAALLDFFNGDKSATIVIHERGKQKEVPLKLFFRGWDEFPPLERKSIEMCRGRVLDIGAGTGCHSLVLQERGLSVCAIDFLSQCVEIMKKRGVKEAHQGDIHTFEAEPFDTLLCLMNGLAVVKNLAGLEPFLRNIRRLIRQDGQFLVDSTDRRPLEKQNIGVTSNPESSYPGEAHLQLEYKNRKGEPFTQLYVDPETLTEFASRAGWRCETIEEGEARRYLARLTLL